MGLDKPALTERLEQLVEGEGLVNVLEGLAQIASEKADRARAMWQDRALASEWQRAAAMLARIANRVAV